MSEQVTIRPTEVRKAARAVRKAVGLALAMMDARDVQGAYTAAEAAQHAAYDMKRLLVEGGEYRPEEQA